MNPLLLDVPETLETGRLLLRRPRPGDGAALNDALRESWAGLRPWMAWAQGEPPPVEASEALQRQAGAQWIERHAFHFGTFLKATGQFAGKLSLFRIEWAVPKGEIGYWQRTSLVGGGLMTEAVGALTDFALDPLRFARVEIRCDPRNARSRAIPERLGYLREACLRNDCRDPQGGLRDTLVYATVRPEGQGCASDA